MLEFQQLGKHALQYLRKTLASGDRLGRYLLESDLERGQARAYLPREVLVDRIGNFAEDFVGLGASAASESDEHSFHFVRTHLSASPMNLAVWEGWPEKVEGELPRTEGPAHFWNTKGIWSVWDRPGGTRHDSRTRYIYSLGPADQKTVANIFRGEARSYPTICVLTEISDTLHFESSPFDAPDSLLATL